MLQIQGLEVRVNKSQNIGFIYCRSTPNNEEVNEIKKKFENCTVLMGDFNISSNDSKDKKKLDVLCGTGKCLPLKEITRRLSNSQPDHILIDKSMEHYCFVTSYFNFISDHNTIVVRIGAKNNLLTDEAKERISFNAEMHLKPQNYQNMKRTGNTNQSTL